MLRRVLFIIALLCCAAYLFAQSPAQDAVRAAESARRDALLSADTVALGRLIAPEFTEISRFGTLRTRADNLTEIANGALHLLTIRYDSTSVRVYGDVAVLTAIADNTGTFHGTAFAGRVWYTRVFTQRDGRWQAVLMQQTMLPSGAGGR